MLKVKIPNDLDFQTRFEECRYFMDSELNFIKTNFRKLRTLKQNAIESIERNKLELRQKYDPTNSFKVGENVEKFRENRISVKKLQDTISEMDQ